MIDRSRQILVLALFAVLQFFMQPLAMASSCVMLGDGDAGCCCAHQIDHESEGESSCCSEQEPESQIPDDGECDWYVSPTPDPVTPVEDARPLLTTASWIALHVACAYIPVVSDGGFELRVARDRVPRVSRSRLVLYQVFRI